MNRTIGGLPVIYWVLGLGLGIAGFAWFKKKGSAPATPGSAAKTGTNNFTQAQEVQDFQIFSALTGAQQASDLNFLTEVAGLFSGGSSTGTTGTGGAAGGGGGSAVPSPPSTGTAPPATVPVSNPNPLPAPAAPAASSLPGFGAGVPELAALNPGILQANSPGGPNIPGITGYTVSYNGVPL